MEINYKMIDKRKISELGLTVISFVSIFVSAVILFLSVFLYTSEVNKIDGDAVRLESQVACMKILTERGFTVSPTDDGLNVNRLIMRDHKINIYMFDSIASRCKNYEMENFCYSPNRDCEERGLNAKLKYRAPFIYKN